MLTQPDFQTGGHKSISRGAVGSAGDGLMATGLEVRLREPNTSALLFYQRV